VFNKHIEKLSARLDVYDDILSKQKYVAGNVCAHLGFGADYELRVFLGNHPSRPLSYSVWIHALTGREQCHRNEAQCEPVCENETGTFSSFNPRSLAGLQRFARALHGKRSRTASRVPLNDSCSYSYFDTYS
jgi:hypothetical protein